MANVERRALDVRGHDLRGAAAVGHEDAVGLLEHAQGLERQVLRVARADADADQPHAATSRSATSGVAAQWVCR